MAPRGLFEKPITETEEGSKAGNKTRFVIRPSDHSRHRSDGSSWYQRLKRCLSYGAAECRDNQLARLLIFARWLRTARSTRPTSHSENVLG